MAVGTRINDTIDATYITDDNDDDDGNNIVQPTEEHDGKSKWKDSKVVGSTFFDWLHRGDYGGEVSGDVDLSSVDRDQVHLLFVAFLNSRQGKLSEKQRRRMEGLAMAAMRRTKLMKSRRYNDGVVICTFAREDRTFAPLRERRTARDFLLQRRDLLKTDKGGVVVTEDPVTNPNGPVLPINVRVSVDFDVRLEFDAQTPVVLQEIRISGSHKKHFRVTTEVPFNLPDDGSKKAVRLQIVPKSTAVYRGNVMLKFLDGTGKVFSILRSVILRSGDADMYDILKPTSEYVKKKHKKHEKPTKEEDIMDPPKEKGSGGKNTYSKKLKPNKVPLDVRELVENREMEGALVAPTSTTPSQDFAETYSTFWQNLLWTSELQAYEDIKLFDLEGASLQRSGRFLKLYVAGLAEGRPSVLRGDIVLCSWKGKEYRGRVAAVELLDVLMEFHSSFHRNFNVNLDKVDRVRFTFSRTTFRTSHAGVFLAPRSMGPKMLLPHPAHVARIQGTRTDRIDRVCPETLRWTSQTLNREQQHAVQQIVKASLRPMPYIIFGPPGTGKTTTMVEAVYQLATLHKYDSKQEKLNILLVAPSNDATDILVEKLSPYFPPSEMIRVLAYTRSINQVPEVVRPYCREGMEPCQLIPEIMSIQITVATMNMAARFAFTGEKVRKGYFDVMCVDEAGHATEPEVIAAAATLMKFDGKKPGQLVLAGDPMQLGPIITSELCKKFGLCVSYMERLIKTSPAYAADDGDQYPAELVTLLVNNYRSHPDILKLPNEMFYHNQLIPCGDHFATHSMTKWEHLPKSGFPIVFHAVDGENTREGNSPSWFNPQEALVVVDYVKNLVKHSRPPIRQDEIGIITPYARQVQKIQLALKVHDIGDVKVGSVETFQGQEHRVIIISTVRSENELLSHDRKYNLGFVANEKRFNVAVTRAKALLVVVGNPRVLATDEKNWLPMLRFCRDNNSWLGAQWDEGSTDEDIDDLIGAAAGDDESDDEDWAVVTDHEARGYINREE